MIIITVCFLLNDRFGLFREKNCSVAIRFEIHAHIEFEGGVMKVFHPGASASHRHSQMLADVVRRRTISVGRLNESELKGKA